MEFFTHLEEILRLKLPEEKCQAFKAFYSSYLSDHMYMDHSLSSVVFDEPSYTGYCQLVSPTVVLKRKKLDTDRGKAIFLHAIAHIEYAAIDLAMDAAYRFKNMPKAFYDDWLSVANDEVRHFELLQQRLRDVGSYYGDLPVHNALFEAAYRTPILHERMAVVPRYLEANGLDVTPMMIDKLKQLESDSKAQKMIEALELILKEECDHVFKGDVWFKYACDQAGLEYECYFDIIEAHYPGSFPRKKQLNVKARQAAGFSCGELKRMNGEIECS